MQQTVFTILREKLRVLGRELECAQKRGKYPRNCTLERCLATPDNACRDLAGRASRGEQ